MRFWLKDPKNGKESVSLTAFAAGFGVATIKLFVAGLTVGSFTMSAFTGSDYALVVGTVAGLYWARRKDNKTEPK